MARRCKRCHRVLTDPAAISAGYGPVCYAKEFGSRFPNPEKERVKAPRRRRADARPLAKPRPEERAELPGQMSLFDFDNKKAPTRRPTQSYKNG